VTAPSDFLFWYRARVVNVVDGDTLDLETDLGFRVAFGQRYRLYGVDTRELNDPDPVVRERAVRAKEFVETRVGGSEVVIRTHMDRRDKYERWLAVVYFLEDAGTWRYVNEDLIAEGFAVRS